MVSVNSLGSSNRAHRGHEDVIDIARQGKADIAEQRKAIVNNPDMTITEKKEALAGLNQAESAYDQVINNGTKGTGLLGWVADLANKNEGNLSANWKLLEGAESSLEKVDAIMGKHGVSPMSACDEPSHCQNVNKTEGENKAEGGGKTGSSSKSSKSDEAQQQAYKANFAGKEPTELANWASADPKGFYENLKDLSPEDRQSTMMMMNQHLQDMNQMFSMMSNLAKAQHDTAKALIGNMRV